MIPADHVIAVGLRPAIEYVSSESPTGG